MINPKPKEFVTPQRKTKNKLSGSSAMKSITLARNQFSPGSTQSLPAKKHNFELTGTTITKGGKLNNDLIS